MHQCDFTYRHLDEIFSTALRLGYTVMPLAQWYTERPLPEEKVLVLRVDVDDCLERTWVFRDIFNRQGVKASFFFRLHANEYNVLALDNMRLLRTLVEDGHEVELHTEVEDVAHLCGLPAEKALEAGLATFRAFFGTPNVGTASHGSLTIYNNLDFWKTHKPESFGLKYEAYGHELWDNSLYVSDSELIRWKCYQNGVRVPDDSRCPCEHLAAGTTPLYLLIHPQCFFQRHYHETAPVYTQS